MLRKLEIPASLMSCLAVTQALPCYLTCLLLHNNFLKNVKASIKGEYSVLSPRNKIVRTVLL